MGAVTLTNSTVSHNLTYGGPDNYGGGGGGIFNFGGNVVLNSSTVYFNTSSNGGGIYNGGAGTLTLINSTIAGNSAAGAGGGIENDSSTAVVSFSTVWNNSASGNPDATTVSLNLPPTGSGGSCCIFILSGPGGGIDNSGPLTIKNSILSANTAPFSGNCQNDAPSSELTSLGHNLSDDATCTFFTGTGDLNSTAAGLAPAGLQNNGGPTETVALLATSAAVNAIPVSPTNYCTDANGNPVTTDQRGVPRPQGSGCDIGAFEYFHSLYLVPAVQTLVLADAVQASTLPRIVQVVLKVPLQAAVDSLNQGNVRAAKGQLEAFVILVDVDRLAGGLSQEEAAAWTSSATAIIQSLGS